MPSAWKKLYHAARAPTLADDDTGATITGSTVTVEGCGADSLQGDVRFAEVMELMGAQVQWQPFSITITGAPAAPLATKTTWTMSLGGRPPLSPLLL